MYFTFISCLEEVCRFPGLAQRKQLTYSAKQLIAREVYTYVCTLHTCICHLQLIFVFQVEIEKMRRAERILSGQKSSSQRSVRLSLTAYLNSATVESLIPPENTCIACIFIQ